jgi:hypothetical protein
MRRVSSTMLEALAWAPCNVDSRPLCLQADHVENPDALVSMIQVSISSSVSASLSTGNSKGLPMTIYSVDTTPVDKLDWGGVSRKQPSFHVSTPAG